MSPTANLFLFLLILIILVFVVYITVVRAFYWWGRGTPPPTGDEKRRLREEELQLRAKQIEHSRNNPIATRKSSFWDNTKVYHNRDNKDD